MQIKTVRPAHADNDERACRDSHVRRFLAYVWFEATRAVTPLPAAPGPGAPETWPFRL